MLGMGVLVWVAAPLAWWTMSTPARMGNVEQVEQALEVTARDDAPARPERAAVDPTAPVGTTATTAPVGTPEASRPDAMIDHRQASAGDLVPERRAAPTWVRIEALAVEAPVVAAGVDPRSGQMEVPPAANQVGWYRFGPVPGEEGSAVLAAHVDVAGQGPGAFFQLEELQPGDVIVVGFEDGSERRFVTRARTRYHKSELPLDSIFSRRGPPVLTLVTCGGGFNQTERTYDSNVVVYASPAVSLKGGSQTGRG